jgi:tRNA(His) 5'-end guanylyltransferase
MKKYKENLRAVSASRTDEMTQLRSSQVEAFCNLVSALTFWEQTIREIALAEL